MLKRVDIAALIPHAGAMCLLDEVLDWTATTILCRATSHRAPDNPLAANGQLAAICGVEYAGQAMAAHGGLASPEAGHPPCGYLASLRALRLAVARLDDLPGDLLVSAERLMGEQSRVIYGFFLHCDGALLMQGRAAVVLRP
jgi:predicted hotdog family 3-hydroxylacyl-ACP dehydratase